MERYNKMQLFKQETPIHHKKVKQDIFTRFRPLPETCGYQPQFIDPRCQQKPYWNDTLYEQEILEYKHNFIKPTGQSEDADMFIDWNVSDKLRYALINFWTVNPQLPNTSPLPNFWTPSTFTKRQTPVINKEKIPQLQSISSENMKFLQWSTNLQLKKKRMIYTPMDFGEITILDLIETGALTHW